MPPFRNNLNKEVMRELREFNHPVFLKYGGGATQAQTERLYHAINLSPLLVENVNKSVKSGYIQGLRLETNPEFLGSYSTGNKKLRINPLLLDTPQNKNSWEELGRLVFLIGHETRHSLDKLDIYEKSFEQSLQKQAQQKEHRNYTDEVEAYVKFYRKSEARAEIDGFNAVVSMLKQKNSKPTLKQIYHAATEDMKIYITKNNEAYSLKHGLVQDKDGYLPITNQKNLETVGKIFYDNPGFYPPYYGSYAVAQAIHYEQKKHGAQSKIYLNMDRLEKIGIDELSLREQLQTYNIDFDSVITTSPPQLSIRQKQSLSSYTLDTISTQSLSHAEALIAKYQAAAAAMDADSPNAATEMARSNPTVQKIMERFDAELERRQSLREFENSRYTLENMPERARDLHAQITDKLTAYVKENNLPYTKEGLQNSITALTAEAFDQKMTQVDHIGIHNDKLAVHQDGRFIHDFAEVDAFQSQLTPERDSFQNIVQAEQKHEQEAQQRETERQMEQSRGMGMSR